MATMDLDLSPRRLVLRLSELLVEKGVSAPRAEERATMGLKKIGATELQQALDSANPWAYLKAIGSRPHVAFQWLKSDELQNKIRARAPTSLPFSPLKSASSVPISPRKMRQFGLILLSFSWCPRHSLHRAVMFPRLAFLKWARKLLALRLPQWLIRPPSCRLGSLSVTSLWAS